MSPFTPYILAASLAVGAGGTWYVMDLRHDLKAARAELATAKTQATVNQAGADINDTRCANVARARKHAEEGRHAVDTAPDIDSALGSLGDALDRVRAEGHRPVAEPDRGRPDAGR
jgi:hypothetical protein